MHVKFGLWRLDGGDVRPVASTVIASEDRLEEILENRTDILGSGALLLIGRQVVTDFGKRVDLLAMDGQGDLHVIELKKDKTPRDVVAQALEYGFWVQALSYDAIRDLYAKHHQGQDFDSAFTDHFEADVPETLNSGHHLVIVATGMDTSTAQIVEYVRGYGVPINVLFFQYLKDDSREYLARSWLSNPDLEPATGGAGAKKQPPWNGLDFYVAVGESQHRNWDDMRRYGFVSAGHGDKYRKAMMNLSPGARVWAAIPSTGYVGVGEVAATAVSVAEFEVEVDGVTMPVLQAPLVAAQMGEDADDPALSEYLVRIRWIDTRPREEAVWVKGMYANQNVVTKLRQPFTLQRLAEAFDVDE
ncbi:hypothetical protein [Nocardia asteroides]|uniref:hypothetical protein n=1 Tax=Nocardia asteroides TaxID=1824 RepID=UPI001E524A77|nr:hypothetical protein [Nocardia asteroides]UGT58795.1 hypothetical protein LTT85_32095 [Nocardia asteroides]